LNLLGLDSSIDKRKRLRLASKSGIGNISAAKLTFHTCKKSPEKLSFSTKKIQCYNFVLKYIKRKTC
jgi:hypothetical protein